MNPYAQGLDKCAANYQPLTPLTFLARAAAVYPEHPAVVHGSHCASATRNSMRAAGALPLR